MAKQTNIRRRGKAWVVSARVNGTQQWKSCRTRDEAELELARMIAQRARGETFVALPPKRDSDPLCRVSNTGRAGRTGRACAVPVRVPSAHGRDHDSRPAPLESQVLLVRQHWHASQHAGVFLVREVAVRRYDDRKAPPRVRLIAEPLKNIPLAQRHTRILELVALDDDLGFSRHGRLGHVARTLEQRRALRQPR
jgi:hypothetical protein